MREIQDSPEDLEEYNEELRMAEAERNSYIDYTLFT